MSTIERIDNLNIASNNANTAQIELLNVISGDIIDIFKRSEVVSLLEYEQYKIQIPDGYDWSPAINQLLLEHDGEVVYIPEGTYIFNEPIKKVASKSKDTGLKIIGAGMLKTIIKSRASNDYAIQITTNTDCYYTNDSWLQGFTLTTDRSNLNVQGIKLNGCWFVDLYRLKIEGMAGDGITSPLRTDISSYTDHYQTFQVRIEQCLINACSGWGINGACGVGFADVSIIDNHIVNNAGGGVYIGSNNFIVSRNAINGNKNCGLMIDSVGSVANCSKVENNELDSNENYNIWCKALTTSMIACNRLNAKEYNGALKPAVQIRFGDTGKQAGKLEIKNNEFKSDSPINAYASTAMNLSGLVTSKVVNNGFANNTTNLTKYIGWNINNKVEVIEDNDIVYASSTVPCTIARLQTDQNVSSTTSVGKIIFENKEIDLDGCYNASTGIYTVPYTGIYSIDYTLTISGLSSGNEVRLSVYQGGNETRRCYYTASGIANETFSLITSTYAIAGTIIQVGAYQNSGSDKAILPGSLSNSLVIKGSI